MQGPLYIHNIFLQLRTSKELIFNSMVMRNRCRLCFPCECCLPISIASPGQSIPQHMRLRCKMLHMCRAQVATDTRLWLYGALQDTRGYLADLIKTAVVRAESDVDVLMPGFTHLQVGAPRSCTAGHVQPANKGCADRLAFCMASHCSCA